jgi:FrsA-like alpha/beta hydrolase family protein
MRAATEQRVKRWSDQRWLLDTVIQSVGMEWDQPRLGYTLYPAGPDAIGDFRMVGTRVRKFADMHREFAAAGKRREAKASGFEAQGRLISARESYFIAALLYSAARWPIFETNSAVVGYNDRMNHCYGRFAALMNRPIERVEIPFGVSGKALPAWLHLPREPKPGEKFPCAIGIDGMDASKEIMCSMYGDKFLERGMAHFVYDGPGQGECPIRELFVTPSNHKDAAFFGLQAAAALKDKIKGAAVSFVCHQPGLNTLMNMAAPSFKMRFMYMAGYEDEIAFDKFVEEFTLERDAASIAAPVLIQGGEDDELSPIVCSDDLMTRIRPPKNLVVYEGERHAIGGNNLSSSLGENWMAMLVDWCQDRVEDKPAPNERVFINSLGQSSITPY